MEETPRSLRLLLQGGLLAPAAPPFVLHEPPKPRRALRRERAKEQNDFRYIRRAEAEYQRRLRKVAAQIGHLANLIDPENPDAAARAEQLLRRYALDLIPWATVTGTRMLADVNQRDMRAWMRLSDIMGQELEREIREAPTGFRMRELLAEQVKYITSLPLDAAERIHKFALKGIVGGDRANALSEVIQTTHRVSRSRADLIARTETGRCSTALTQSRAEFVQSPGYIWRAVMDADTRQEHRKLNGTFHRWNDPPIAGPHGERAHAGAIFNCRCWTEPVLA